MQGRWVVALLLVACGSDSPDDVAGTDGSSGASSSASTVGATNDPGTTSGTTETSASTPTDDSSPPTSTADGSTTDDPPPPGDSDLPVPPGPDDLPPPDGTPGNLRVLPWAGFAAAVSYTFDDGQPTHIEYWPDLKATGVNVTFYITTSNSGLPGYAEAFTDAAASGSEIANHTVHHCYYDDACGGAAAGSHDAELDECDAYILDTLGIEGVWTMAYPFGDTGYRDAAAARYLLARGVGGGRIAPSDGTDPFNLPTFAAVGGEAQDVFDAAIDDTRDAGEWMTFLFHSILPGENWYAGVDLGAITGSIEHGKSLGDVWLDSVVRVGAYWIGQTVVENATTSMRGDDMQLSWTLPEHFPTGRYLRVTVDGGALSQGGTPLEWDGHGYYEVALDAGELTIAP